MPQFGEASAPHGLHRQQRSCDRRWQIPCWLTSFVLHLTAVVVLGSLTVPVSRQRTMVALLLSLGDIDAPNDDGPAELATTISLDAIDDITSPAATEGGAKPGSDALAVSEDHIPAVAEAPIIRPAMGLDDASGAPFSRQTGRGLPANSGPVAAAGGTNPADDGDSADNDDIVARFIEFDVGHLRGAEGQKAKQDFDRLGTDALASLIRGLNKSAKMQASCPVMVISQKLGALLRENPHPALLRYALDNIGRDVKHGSPHIAYLHGLVNQLRQMDPTYSGLNVPMLLGSLKSRDVRGAIEAANVLAGQANRLMEFEKEDVAWALIQALNHPNDELRSAARSALICLAGTDCGPTDDRRPADRVAAACRWSLELCPDRFEAAAESIMKTARKLADAGKGVSARRSYRKLVYEYAGTQAADEAAQLLKRSGEFAIK